MEDGGIYSPLTLAALSIAFGFAILVLNGNFQGSLFFFGFAVLLIVFHFGVDLLEEFAG